MGLGYPYFLKPPTRETFQRNPDLGGSIINFRGFSASITATSGPWGMEILGEIQHVDTKDPRTFCTTYHIMYYE